MNRKPSSFSSSSPYKSAAAKPWLTHITLRLVHTYFEKAGGSVVRRSISWIALIQDLIACSSVEPCLTQLHDLQGGYHGGHIDSHTLLALLRACGRLNLVVHGQQAHAALVEQGLVVDCINGSTLVHMYGKFGLLDEAEYVLHKVLRRNVIIWTSLIGAYADQGHSTKALDCAKRMNVEGVPPNHVSFICILKACGDIRALFECFGIHDEILKLGFEQDAFVGSALVDAYSKSNCLFEAQKVVDVLQCVDSVTLMPLLVGYAENGLLEETLKCLKTIFRDELYVDIVTLKCSLKACGSTQCLDWGRKIHTEIIKRGVEFNLQVLNGLVDMYAKCGSLIEAELVFCGPFIKDVVSYNTLMHAYAELDLGFKVNKCLAQMRLARLVPTSVTFVCCLNACKDIEVGQEMHMELNKLGLEANKYAASSLVDMYIKFGLFAEAITVFCQLSDRNTVLWTALISGYADHNFGEEAMQLFGKMICEGVPADAVTFFCALKVCGDNGALERGQELHAFITSEGFERDPYVCSMLVEMYTSCGFLQDAEEVNHKVLVPTGASWTALIVGYAKNDLILEALNCLKNMCLEGQQPMNAVTFACSLRLCGSAGILNQGFRLHAKLVREGLDQDFLIEKALLDFYGKCGLLLESQNIFDKLPRTDIVSWTVLIISLAWCQREKFEIISLFQRMEEQGIEPDSVAFLTLLTACSHVGLVDEGQGYFVYMCEGYGVAPGTDHINCMIDIYSRTGQFRTAVFIIDVMPYQPDRSTCHTVLSACRKGGVVELGRQMFQSAMMLEDIPHVAFLLLLGICEEINV